MKAMRITERKVSLALSSALNGPDHSGWRLDFLFDHFFSSFHVFCHTDTTIGGTFAWTLPLTDIMTGWTDLCSIGETASEVHEALARIASKAYLSGSSISIYVDNGSEFLNDEIVNDFAKPRGIGIRGSKIRRKNDQCCVETKELQRCDMKKPSFQSNSHLLLKTFSSRDLATFAPLKGL